MEFDTFRISPIVRLNMTFDAEMSLDQRGVFNKETYEAYLERLQHSEARLHQMIRSLMTTNIVMFLILGGQNFSIPMVGISIASIPVVNEIALITAAVSFFFLCATFITNQAYVGIINQFGNRIVDQNAIDPDFFNASRLHFDFFLKVFRPKLNIWAADVYQSGRSFKIFCAVIGVIVVCVLSLFPIAHLALSAWSGYVTIQSELHWAAKAFVLSAAAVINFSGVVMVFGAYKEFDFLVPRSSVVAGD